MKLHVLTAAALAAAGLPALALAAASPFDGIWRTDLGSFQPSKRPTVIVVKDGEYACRSCTPAYTVKADGAFHPVAGHPAFDEFAFKVIDARTTENTMRKGGRVTEVDRTTLSPDGRTATVSWTETPAAGVKPATGVELMTRTAAGPTGAHALSGSWVDSKAVQASDNSLRQTIKLENGRFSWRNDTGQSFTAAVDGPPAPVAGDPGVTTTAVKRIGPRELEETDMYEGKPVTVYRMTVSPDGRKLTTHVENKRNGEVSTITADKV